MRLSDILFRNITKRTYRAFGPDDGGGDGGAGGDDAAKAAAAAAAAAKAAADGGGQKHPDEVPKFSQRDLNAALNNVKKEQEKKAREAITQLETLKKEKGLSDQARDTLQQQIEDQKNSLLTKEEQAKKELEKRDKEYKSSLETTVKDRDAWKKRYEEESATNEILLASRQNDAVADEQLLELLKPKTRLVELQDDGKPTGKYQNKVKLTTKNDKKEVVELDLTIGEAVKRMKDEPERFGNLFKSTLQGGLGAGGSNGNSSLNSDKPPADPAQYKIWRAEQKKLGKL